MTGPVPPALPATNFGGGPAAPGPQPVRSGSLTLGLNFGGSGDLVEQVREWIADCHFAYAEHHEAAPGARTRRLPVPWAADGRTFAVIEPPGAEARDLAWLIEDEGSFHAQYYHPELPVRSIVIVNATVQPGFQAELASRGFAVRVYTASTAGRVRPRPAGFVVEAGGHWDIHGDMTRSQRDAVIRELSDAVQSGWQYANRPAAGGSLTLNDRYGTAALGREIFDRVVRPLASDEPALDLAGVVRDAQVHSDPEAVVRVVVEALRGALHLDRADRVVDLERSVAGGEWLPVRVPAQVRNLYTVTGHHVNGVRPATFTAGGPRLAGDATRAPGAGADPAALATWLGEMAFDGKVVPPLPAGLVTPVVRGRIADHLVALGRDRTAATELLNQLVPPGGAPAPAPPAPPHVAPPARPPTRVPVGGDVKTLLSRLAGLSGDLTALRNLFAAQQFADQVADRFVPAEGGDGGRPAQVLIEVMRVAYLQLSNVLARQTFGHERATAALSRQSMADLREVAGPELHPFLAGAWGQIRDLFAQAFIGEHQLAPEALDGMWVAPLRDAATSAPVTSVGDLLDELLDPEPGRPATDLTTLGLTPAADEITIVRPGAYEWSAAGQRALLRLHRESARVPPEGYVRQRRDLDAFFGADPFGLRDMPPPTVFSPGPAINVETRALAQLFRMRNLAADPTNPADQVLAAPAPTAAGDDIWTGRGVEWLGPEKRTEERERTRLPQAEMPLIVHTFWYGSVLTPDGPNGYFWRAIANIGYEARRQGMTTVLWTTLTREDVSRGEPDVQAMLAWARAYRIILIDVYEFFNAQTPMLLMAPFQLAMSKGTSSGFAEAKDLSLVEVLFRFGGIGIDGDNQIVDLRGLERVHSEYGFALEVHEGGYGNSSMMFSRRHPAAMTLIEILGKRYALSQDKLFPYTHTGKITMAEQEAHYVRGPARYRAKSVMERSGPLNVITLVLQLGYHPERQQPPAVTQAMVSTGTAHAWLVDAQPSRGPEPDRAVTLRRAVTYLMRELTQRNGDLHLLAVEPLIAKLLDPDAAWESVIGFIMSTPEIRRQVRTVTYRRLTNVNDKPGAEAETRDTTLALPPSVRSALGVPEFPAPEYPGAFGRRAALSVPARPAALGDIDPVRVDVADIAGAGLPRFADQIVRVARSQPLELVVTGTRDEAREVLAHLMPEVWRLTGLGSPDSVGVIEEDPPANAPAGVVEIEVRPQRTVAPDPYLDSLVADINRQLRPAFIPQSPASVQAATSMITGARPRDLHEPYVVHFLSRGRAVQGLPAGMRRAPRPLPATPGGPRRLPARPVHAPAAAAPAAAAPAAAAPAAAAEGDAIEVISESVRPNGVNHYVVRVRPSARLADVTNALSRLNNPRGYVIWDAPPGAAAELPPTKHIRLRIEIVTDAGMTLLTPRDEHDLPSTARFADGSFTAPGRWTVHRPGVPMAEERERSLSAGYLTQTSPEHFGSGLDDWVRAAPATGSREAPQQPGGPGREAVTPVDVPGEVRGLTEDASPDRPVGPTAPEPADGGLTRSNALHSRQGRARRPARSRPAPVDPVDWLVTEVGEALTLRRIEAPDPGIVRAVVESALAQYQGVVELPPGLAGELAEQVRGMLEDDRTPAGPPPAPPEEIRRALRIAERVAKPRDRQRAQRAFLAEFYQELQLDPLNTENRTNKIGDWFDRVRKAGADPDNPPPVWDPRGWARMRTVFATMQNRGLVVLLDTAAPSVVLPAPATGEGVALWRIEFSGGGRVNLERVAPSRNEPIRGRALAINTCSMVMPMDGQRTVVPGRSGGR